MALQFGPLIVLDKIDKTAWTVHNGEPATGNFDGEIIIDSSTNEFKIWYNEVWNVLGITITPGALNDLLLETGDGLLKEDGDRLSLQQ